MQGGIFISQRQFLFHFTYINKHKLHIHFKWQLSSLIFFRLLHFYFFKIKYREGSYSLGSLYDPVVWILIQFPEKAEHSIFIKHKKLQATPKHAENSVWWRLLSFPELKTQTWSHNGFLCFQKPSTITNIWERGLVAHQFSTAIITFGILILNKILASHHFQNILSLFCSQFSFSWVRVLSIWIFLSLPLA